MKIPHERIRHVGHELILKHPVLIGIPPLGVMGVASEIIRQDIPDTLHTVAILGLGYMAHLGSKEYFGFEIDRIEDEESDYIWEINSTWPESSTAQHIQE